MFENNLVDHNVLAIRLVNWVWPPQGFIKLNVDDSSSGNPGLARFGGLARGDDGRRFLVSMAPLVLLVTCFLNSAICQGL